MAALSPAQLDSIYTNLCFQLKIKICEDFGSIANFSKVSGINRTSLVSVFSENIARDMSIELYLRILAALKVIPASEAPDGKTESGIRLKAYLSINNNLIMNSISIISLNL